MNVGVGGSICIITLARYSGVCAKAITSPSASPSTAAVTRRTRFFQRRLP
jgi:hypothetical protein